MNLGDAFAWPAGWPLLLAIPVVAVLLRWAERARARRLARLVGPRTPILARELLTGRRKARRWLFVVGLAAAILAVLQPLGGEATRSIEQRGIDIVVALDVSRSMLARDVAPDRLERARSEIAALAARIEGDRLGLVVFAGDARLVVPLTQDVAAYLDLLASVDVASVARGGTDLGLALETTLQGLGTAAGGHEVVLLLTDGEDLEERGLRAAERCRARGVVVHTVGVGSARGSKIPVDEGAGEVFLRDRAGREVVSTLDVGGLGRIARVTGGEYRDGSGEPGALVAIYQERLLPMARKAFASSARRARGNRFQWPLLFAFLVWILELSLTDRKRR